MKKLHFATMLFASSILYPAVAAAQQPGNGSSCDVLVNYLERYEEYNFDFPVSLEEAQRFQRDRDQQACRDGINRIDIAVRQQEQNQAQDQAETRDQAQAENRQGRDQQQADQEGDAAQDGTIVVQQQPPRILVDQAAPQVSVAQSQPQVTVRQPQPEILVHQPAPTITVDIPQPRITVRMPEPDVNVALAPPEVEVQQPEPEVRVAQPEPPQIDVERDQAEIMLQRQQQEAEVSVSRSGEPTIRYEREEPQVRINRAEGEPEIRVENAEQQTATEDQSAADRAEREPATTGSVQQNAQSAEASAGIRVSTLIDSSVRTEQDREVGRVQQIMINPETGDSVALIGLNGEIGEQGRRIGLTLDHLVMRGDALVITGLSDQQLETAPEWRQQAGFREANGQQTAQIEREEQQ